MKQTFKIIFAMIKTVLLEMREHLDILFDDHSSCMSRTSRKIFAHPEDRKLYLEAVDRLRAGSKEETLTLETVGTIKLIIVEGPHIIVR